MSVLPSRVKEYSTAMAFDLVTRLAINARLRRVLVGIRWETLPTWRRNCPCRSGFSFSENKTLGVHLPMKIAGTILELCTAFIMFRLLQELHHGMTFRISVSQFSCAQLGTHVYLGFISWRQLFACDSCEADATVLAYRATFT
jgi:hypothetical protein